MGKLFTIGNIEIRVRIGDHLPAHFHVLSPDGDAQVAIETSRLMAGTMPRAHYAAVQAWIETHRAELVVEWNKCNPRFPIV